MKSSIVTVSEGSLNFFNTFINKTVAFTTTVAALILKVFKAKDVAACAYVIDRTRNDSNTVGHIAVKNAADRVDPASGFMICSLTGKKAVNSSLMQWGLGNVTPAAIDAAVSGAFNGLDWANNQNGLDNDSLAKLKAVILPNVGDLSPRYSLENIVELLKELRVNLADTMNDLVANEGMADPRIVMEIIQNDDVATIDIFFADFDGIKDHADADAYFIADMLMPETVAAQQAAVRLALE